MHLLVADLTASHRLTLLALRAAAHEGVIERLLALALQLSDGLHGLDAKLTTVDGLRRAPSRGGRRAPALASPAAPRLTAPESALVALLDSERRADRALASRLAARCARGSTDAALRLHARRLAGACNGPALCDDRLRPASVLRSVN